ncbi:MAG: ABC transporter permease [Bryobacteraceae bacterium]|nr:ABC transporter permease [Bryobacteraceae bacterium]
MSFRRLRAVFRKEGLHIIRDPRSLMVALSVPVVMILLFGYALTLDVDQIPTVIYDQDHSPESRALIEEFKGSRFFSVTETLDGHAAIRRGIDHSHTLLGVVIPGDFSRSLAREREASVQLIIDGSDSNTASIAAGYAEALVMSHSAQLRDAALKHRGLGELKMPIDARIRVLYNHELKSKNFIIPGIIAVVLMIISALLTSLTIAREWESGTMEQLLSTPVRPVELLLGKLCAYFVLGMADVALALVVGVGVFDVPLRGNVLLLIATSALFLFGALCWGIFLSTVARSQLLAFQMSIVSSFLPAFILSGFIFAIENMPVVIQQITRIIPARYFVTILQGVFLKGTGLQVLWVEVVFLIVYGAIIFMIASRAMRQKVA